VALREKKAALRSKRRSKKRKKNKQEEKKQEESPKRVKAPEARSLVPAGLPWGRQKRIHTQKVDGHDVTPSNVVEVMARELAQSSLSGPSHVHQNVRFTF
jgi:hypothetical protein